MKSIEIPFKKGSKSTRRVCLPDSEKECDVLLMDEALRDYLIENDDHDADLPGLVLDSIKSERLKRGLISKESLAKEEKPADSEQGSFDVFLSEMHGSEAIELVKLTDDPKVLGNWKKSEKRKTVLEAIEKRLLDLDEEEGNEE